MGLAYLYDLLFYYASLLCCLILLWGLWICHISCLKYSAIRTSHHWLFLIIHTSDKMSLFLTTQFKVFYPQSNSPSQESALFFLKYVKSKITLLFICCPNLMPQKAKTVQTVPGLSLLYPKGIYRSVPGTTEQCWIILVRSLHFS